MQALRRVVRSTPFQIFTSIALLVALFAVDLAQIYEVPTNRELDMALSSVLVIFMIEFVLQNLCEASYPFSFFFWMDLIGTVSMTSDISYMFGSDVTLPIRLLRKSSGGSGGGSILIVRAARAARLGARAGRLSRVIKILRLMPFMSNKAEQESLESEHRMAKVISQQLSDALAMRVSFTIIFLVVCLPVFHMFDYPEMDDSMKAWTEMLAMNVKDFIDTSSSSARLLFSDELQRCADFYSAETYGPFKACRGHIEDGNFICESIRDLPMTFDSDFTAPARGSSIWIMTADNFQLYFSLAMPKTHESIGNIMLICFIIFTMTCFGAIMNAKVSEIALKPLERMLSVVRDKCAIIFKFADELQDDDGDEGPQLEGKTEIDLLESAVLKLTTIARLHAASKMPDIEDMSEEAVMKLNLAGQRTSTAVLRSTRGSVVVDIFRAGSCKRSPRESSMGKPSSMSAAAWASQGTALFDSDFPEHSIVQNIFSLVPIEIIDSITSDDFNSLDFTDDHSEAVCRYILCASTGCRGWVRDHVEEKALTAFVKKAKSKYLSNPFHNWAHGLDVAYTVARNMRMIGGGRFFSEETHFAIIVAAVGHDLGHTGVNNQYLIETSHKVALTYNDRSPLENMHCSELFHILNNDDETNILRKVDKVVYKEMRSNMISMIMHTDMISHQPMVKDLGLLYHTSSDAFELAAGTVNEDPDDSLLTECLTTAQNQQLILNALLHTADVNNPLKPWFLCKRLAMLCMDEFFAQGDLERQAKLPIGMLNDRHKVNVAQSQIGFVEFMIAPLAEAVVQVFPQLDEISTHLGNNIQHWFDQWVQESRPAAEELEKTTIRVKKVIKRTKLVEEAEERSPGVLRQSKSHKGGADYSMMKLSRQVTP